MAKRIFQRGEIVRSVPGLPYANLDSLPRGTGCKYLECVRSPDDTVLVAKQWRRKMPTSFDVVVVLKGAPEYGEES